MHASSALKLASLLVMLLSLQIGVVDARAEVVHNCPYPVWCAVVTGYKPDDRTPEDQRPPVNWMPQPAGNVLVDLFVSHPQDTGIAIMCTREPKACKPLVTQLEHAWWQDRGKTGFDVSNVEGAPFVNEWFRMDVDDPASPADTTGKCHGAYCAPGDTNCNQVHHKWDDDFQGMRDCSDSVNIQLTLCSG